MNVFYIFILPGQAVFQTLLIVFCFLFFFANFNMANVLYVTEVESMHM